MILSNEVGHILEAELHVSGVR